MPRIDPLKLLTCLKVLLASNGGIRSENEVKRLAGLMTKYSKKLVSKCIYIQILKCTNTELLGEFMGAGGWSLTHMWLSDGIHAMNWPLVQEILELLLLCPVDVQRLRSNTAPKLVKGLCQTGGNEGVRILATKLVEQWLKIVKGETMTTPQLNKASSNVDGTDGYASRSSIDSKSDNAAKSSVPESNNSSLVEQSHTTAGEASVAEEDPLAIPAAKGDTMSSSQVPQSPPVSQKVNSENALVYQIMVKDGKQVLAKIENSSSGDKSEMSSSEETESKEEAVQSREEDKTADASNKENEKQKGKESESKESKESSKDKEKSRSSKDKDKHREHKSSHKSSSSKSSKSSSSSSTSSNSKSKSSHKSSSEGKNKEKDSEKDRDSEKEKDKHKSSSSSRSSSGSSSSKDKERSKDKDRSSKDKDKYKEKDKDKEKDKEKEKEKGKAEQSEKDRETLSKVTPPSIDKLGKIPKKPKEEIEKSTPTSITIPSKKASMSIEIRKDSDRPKTVKTYKSQFRSHGLSEEAPPPPSRKGLKKPPSQSIPGTSIPSALSLNLNFKRPSPPPQTAPTNSVSNAANKEVTPPAEKKIKLDLTTSTSSEKPGAIKLIAPKPKPSTLVESDLFMDALSASAYFKKDTKKRKRRPSASKESAKEGTTTSPPTSPQTTSPTAKVTPLKFYQDTLEEKDDDKSEAKDESRKEEEDDDDDDDKKEDEDDIPLKRVKESIEEKVRLEREEEERRREEEVDEEPVKKPPGPGCGPDGPPGVLMLHRRKGPKKKLSWRPQEELEDIRYFELDETERVNVTKTFTDMKQMERFNEREAFLMARKLNCEDVMTEQTTWMPLILVDDVPPHPEGSQSKEKKIQAEREQTTLKALYFTRHMIPDSPAEPDMDMEQYQKTEPAVIPLDDITGNPDAVNDFTSMPWPDPKGSPPQCMPDDFNGGQDVQMPNAPFNPFMQFGQPGWQMGGPPGPGMPPPNSMMPPNMMGGPMGPFNNMNMGPPNMMMGPNPDDMPMNNMNMMQPPFGPPGPNFVGPPNPPNNFNNFGPPQPPNMNMNMSPPHMGMSNGPQRGRGGSWRSGSSGPPPNNQGGGNWRPQGPGGNRPNWTHGSSNRICKQFQRGFCRNGHKCNFVHKTFL